MSDRPAEHLRAFLESLGLDDEFDPELADTPERVTELFGELFSEFDENPPEISTFSSEYTGGQSDPVVIAAIPFESMCVHHLLPFFGTVDVAYIPGDTMVGFGSIGRVVDHFAGRPQVQERMIAGIADHLEQQLDPTGLLVRLRARQMCMEMRGAKKKGELISVAGRRALSDGSLRSELLAQFRQTETSL